MWRSHRPNGGAPHRGALARLADCRSSWLWRRVVEAAAVARRMKEIADGGVPYRDMAVLLTGWGDLDIYQGALERLEIPTYALLNEGFYDRREVWDLVLALETLRDPREDRALLGFLRSPFVGVKVKFDDSVPQPLWPLVFVCINPMSAHGPLAELALNIWPGTISPTESV